MTSPDGVRYVAVGSSFAAGPGITPPATDRPSKARQSQRNYPHLVAQRLGLDFLDVTSSGARTEDILHSSQFGQPPQIAALTARTELVTITIGGNDIGYIPSLIAACLPPWIAKVPVLGQRLRRATAPAKDNNRLADTTVKLNEVFATMLDQAPNARILCVDYLTVLPSSYQSVLPFDERTYSALTALATDLDAALARACSDHDRVELITASSHSVAHDAWSEHPWTNGWTRRSSGGNAAFHPNAAGMIAVADLVAKQLNVLD